jgi:ribosomal-protein-serine acetyltransferase
MSIVPGHQGEIGYWLATDVVARGVATRAVPSLIDHAFNELGLRRLLIRVRVGNTRSIAVARRLGFQPEGTARGAELHTNRLHDLEHYAPLR